MEGSCTGKKSGRDIGWAARAASIRAIALQVDPKSVSRHNLSFAPVDSFE